MRNRTFKTPSRTSPKNSKRGCLCADNTYSTKCCDGSLQAQGIGSITKSQLTPVIGYGYKVQLCGHNKKHHVHGNIELIVGKVYYFDLINSSQSGCYEVLEVDNITSGFLWNNIIEYSNCTECETQNP